MDSNEVHSTETIVPTSLPLILGITLSDQIWQEGYIEANIKVTLGNWAVQNSQIPYYN